MLSSPPNHPNTDELSIRLLLACLAAGIGVSKYRQLCEWLDLPTCAFDVASQKHTNFDREIYTPLIQEIISCIPSTSFSTTHYLIWTYLNQIPFQFSMETQKILHSLLLSKLDMKERLTIAYANSATRQCLLCTRARENSSSIDYEQPIAPKKLPSPQSHSLSATLSEKLSNLRLKATQSRI